jgi:hypothetical protein
MSNEKDFFYTKTVDLLIDDTEVGEVGLKWNYRPAENSGGVSWFTMEIPKQKLNVSKYCSNLEDELYSLKSDGNEEPIAPETDSIWKDIQNLEKAISFLKSVNCELEIEEFEEEFQKTESTESFGLIPIKIEIKNLLSKKAMVTFQI